MMKSTILLMLGTSGLVMMGTRGVEGARLRAPMVNDEGEAVIQPTIGNIDGLPNETEGEVATKKPKYTEFFDSDAVEEDDEKESGESYVPEYTKASHASAAAAATVTKGFCAQVLTDIKAKNAPYYVDGEFTGEMRNDLVEQCGATICDWGVKYRNMVDDCGACPENCDGEFDPRAFFSQLLENEDSAAPIIEAILHISKGGDGEKKVHLTLSAAEKDEDEESATGAEDYDPDDYPLPAKEGGEGGVTKQFCVQVLKDIRAKKAPYYVDGEFTGEARESLKDQCGDMVCGWSSSFADLLTGDGCQKDSKDEYLEELLEDDVATDEIATFAEADGE